MIFALFQTDGCIWGVRLLGSGSMTLVLECSLQGVARYECLLLIFALSGHRPCRLCHGVAADHAKRGGRGQLWELGRPIRAPKTSLSVSIAGNKASDVFFYEN